MMRVLRCRGVLFDCDGVLVDSEASVASAWGRWARRLGLDVAMVQGLVHGRRSADTVAMLVPEERRGEELARIDRYEVEDANSVRPVDGALSLLEAIPASLWAVVTSGRAEVARARLSAASLPHPAVLVSAEDVMQGKPDPQGYKLAAESLGVPPDAAVVFEDAPVGIQAARAAGVGTVVGVGDRATPAGADLVVADLRSVRWKGDHLEVREAG
jgi:sugar-phosphatase